MPLREPMFFLAAALSALVGYLLGSLNFGIIICKVFYKTDIRTMGSGNTGMTNVLRNFGKKVAALTLVGDAGKGVAAVLLGRVLFHLLLPGEDVLYGAYVGGVFAILGHLFPLYYGFKGGKGVATAGGVILALNPLLALVLVCIFLVLVLATGMVSLGSVIGISLYPVATFVYYFFIQRRLPIFSTLCALFIALLVVYMHRENIKRIRAGTEYRFGKKHQKPPAEGTEPAPEAEPKTEA